MFRFRRWGVFLFLAVGLMASGFLLGGRLLGNLPDPQNAKTPSDPASILIVDRYGRLLYEVIDPHGNKFVPLPLAEVPLVCRKATIATEDRRFYSHPGIDPLAILRAVWQNWRATNAGAQHPVAYSGASTLTQQIARNLYLPENERAERSLRRKLREAWVAWRLERIYSKDEILALYLNTTYYGHFAVGVEAAAQAYFGVHARELDLAQCALLAGLPQNPSGYNPIENPDAAHNRQRVVLDLMVRDGYISPQQASDAWGERLAYASTPFPIQAPHFVMWVQSQLESILQPETIRHGGLVVTTTLDLDWQLRAEEIVHRRLALLRACSNVAGGASGTLDCDPMANPARRVENAALVAIDPSTGAVRAMVGSPDYFDRQISGAVNGALSPRQPGSAIKPITYAAALDPARAEVAGHQPWTSATLIADLRTVFPTHEGRPYVPLNYDRKFHGPVTVREALANSYNIPAVKTLEYIGVDALVDQAARMGIPWQFQADGRDPARDPESATGIADAAGSRPIETSTTKGALGIAQGPEVTSGQAAAETGLADSPSGFGLALTLGGGEVRLLDLTSAYGAFANGGFLVSPYAIDRVETLDGQVLFSEALDSASAMTLGSNPARGPRRVLDPRVAYLITDILSDEAARRSAFGPGNVLELGRPVAAKTGTTTDWRDNWTIGYSPTLVTGVWVGNADNAPMRDVNGISGAGPIWHDFMMEVLRDSPITPFARPDGLVQVEICADSGLLPGDLSFPLGQGMEDRKRSEHYQNGTTIPCPYRRLEWFISGTEPTEIDTSHRLVTLDSRTGTPAAIATEPGYIQAQAYWVLPPEYQAWARENGIEQPPSPVPSDGQPVDTRGITVLSPPTREDLPEPLAAEEIPPAAHNPNSLALTSPEPNRVYRVDSRLPAQAQQLPITALPGSALANTVQQITLLLDGAPLAIVGGPEYTSWWPLKAGRHTFQAMATDRNGNSVMSRPVAILVQ